MLSYNEGRREGRNKDSKLLEFAKSSICPCSCRLLNSLSAEGGASVGKRKTLLARGRLARDADCHVKIPYITE